MLALVTNPYVTNLVRIATTSLTILDQFLSAHNSVCQDVIVILR